MPSIMHLLALPMIFLASTCQQPTSGTTEETKEDPWKRAAAIVESIKAPTFPDKTFNITAYGAVADSTADCLPAIRSAIEACNRDGGGMVLIPDGTWFVKGPIHLKSNVNLHLSDNTKLKFSTDAKDYLPVVLTRWEAVECYNYSPLIYAYEQQNIAITGKGTLDGQASNDHWWNWVDNKGFGWEPGMPSQGDPESRERLFQWNKDEVPVRDRVLGESAHLRPNFLQPYRCENILIDGITIRNSPMWVMHPVLCENVTIQNVRVISHGPNSDGCDPESCRNVLIRNCYFDTGDDCIALKSGRNQDGRRISRPIENIVIQDCKMHDGHGGVVIGSEVSGGARYVFAENCIMDSPNLDRAIRVKTNKVRGGKIEHLYFRNITVGEVREAVVRVNMLYPIYSDTNQTFIPIVGDILVENVTSQKSTYGVFIEGYDAEHTVNNVVLKNCNFSGVAKGNRIEHGSALQFDNCTINGEPMTAPQ